MADYAEFIKNQINAMPFRPKRVVLVGVSEGVIPAVKVARLLPEVTHLAMIGAGGYSMREILIALKKKSAFTPDIETAWPEIAADSRGISKIWYGNTYRWWAEMMDVNLTKDFLSLDIPILLGIGQRDESVPVESAIFLESKFKQAHKNNLMLMVYKDANHVLTANGVSHRPEFFSALACMLEGDKQCALPALP